MCMKVETGALILGVFTAILSAIVAGLCLISFLDTIISMTTANYAVILNYYDFGMGLGVLIFALNLAVVCFAFSVLLIRGVRKRNARFVKAYFIFGNVLSLSCKIGVVVYLFVCEEGTLTHVAIVWAICDVYLLNLIMVFKTYMKFGPSRLRRTTDMEQNHCNQLLFIEKK